jgi:GMP synthase (glutamine-hydrolysing)
MVQAELPRIAVVDFGGQYAHLIARRIRALGVYSELYAPDSFHPDEHPEVVGVVLSGGPASVTEATPRLRFDLARPRVPVLGLCFGHQLIARELGGQVTAGAAPEYGLAEIRCRPGARLFRGLDPVQPVWMSHGDHVEALPAGLVATASSDRLAIAAFESAVAPVFGFQFHPEVTHTRHGASMLRNFLEVCGAPPSWNAETLADSLVQRIRREAGARTLFLLLSGGVDSLVCLALCVRAVGPDRVRSLHVDTGLMRLNESSEIVQAVADLGYRNLAVAEAQSLFLGRLAGISEPEAKRAIIGELFVEVLHAELGRHPIGDDWMLVQGTIYPDTIESGGTERAARIKTHHNRVAQIERLIQQGRVIEPLVDLYKDEVRSVGRQLGLPARLVDRHPFPGPGLAIRVLGSDGRAPEGYDRDRGIVEQLAASIGARGLVLPVRSVGVQGDSRTYRHPAVLCAPTGLWPGWTALKGCAAEVVNRVPSINRVLLHLGTLAPDALCLRVCSLEQERLDLLRRVDAVVRDGTSALADIWQIPVVALPLFDGEGRQAFVVRPVCSLDAMTADVFEMEPASLQALIASVGQISGVGAIFYDLTTKPPATIEWE